MPKKNDAIYQNYLGVNVRELCGVAALEPSPPPLHNSDTSDFGEIWTIYLYLPKKNNGSDQNALGGHIRELCGAPASESPSPKFKYIRF